jgi:heme/copper-type cytochrome/quinol oxidase subunit 2
MNKRLVFFLALGGLLLVASAVSLWYGNMMPNDVSQYSRYNNEYEGQTNLVTMLGLALVFVGVFVLLYGVATRSKRKTCPPAPFTEHPYASD